MTYPYIQRSSISYIYIIVGVNSKQLKGQILYQYIEMFLFFQMFSFVVIIFWLSSSFNILKVISMLF